MQLLSLISLLLGLLSTAVAASPVDLDKRDPGPSGRVITPQGGASASSFGLGDGAPLHFQYKPVYQYKGDCRSYDCLISTLSVKVALRDSDGKETTLVSKLAPPGGFRDDADRPVIDAWLNLPDGSGDYRVVVYETQWKYRDVITFQAAAPAITVKTIPYP